MIKKIIYKIVSVYRKYWDFPRNWHSNFDYEKDTTDFYKSGKIVEWETK
jgi:hypothetical protein